MPTITKDKMKAARLLNLFAVSAILVAFCLQAWLALPKLAATSDEAVHLGAGYSYWQTHDFRMKEAYNRLVAHRPAPGMYIISAHYVARMRAVSSDWKMYEPVDRIGQSLWVYTF